MDNTSKMTPGPWVVVSMDIGTWVASQDDGNTFVCCMNNKRLEPYDNAQANARAIAALPDLVEACREALSVFDGDGITCTTQAKLRAALAKLDAEGGES